MDDGRPPDFGGPTDAIGLILSRRSTRSGFTDAPVDIRSLKLITACGDAAPSSKAARPWRFHVVTDRSTLLAIADDVESAPDAASYVPHDPDTGRPDPRWVSTVAESADVLRDAPVGIFVENRGIFGRGRRGLLAAPPDAVAASLVGYGLELLGLGAAVENMLLATRSLGLCGVFMGDVLIAEPAIRTRLGIKGDLTGAIALGHARDADPRPIRRPSSDAAVWH